MKNEKLFWRNFWILKFNEFYIVLCYLIFTLPIFIFWYWIIYANKWFIITDDYNCETYLHEIDKTETTIVALLFSVITIIIMMIIIDYNKKRAKAYTNKNKKVKWFKEF